MYILKTEALANEMKSLKKEYLLTNGLGGYSSSTVLQAHTRKYHGILVASMEPPVKRWMTVSKFHERICIENEWFELDLNQWGDQHFEKLDYETVCPTEVIVDRIVTWKFQIHGGSIHKKITMMPYKNTVAIQYVIIAEKALQLEIEPWVSLRDHHEVQTKKSSEHVPVIVDSLSKRLAFKQSDVLDDAIVFYIDSETPFSVDPRWGQSIRLDNEIERGLESCDTPWIPGQWSCHLSAGQHVLSFVVTTHEDETLTATEIFSEASNEQQRLEDAARRINVNFEPKLQKLHEQLSLAASQFIVKRASTQKHTIVAGYPWFTDWGRDSMISLPGLTVSAGRPELFKEILSTFIGYMKEGILPNVFPDQGYEPMYNTVDATLWMPIALHRYFEATHDFDFIAETGLPALRELVHHYQKGTLNATYMDHDALIHSGSPETQLTWMDVKVQGWVVTPRHGKAVEINALWYNALCITRAFEKKLLERQQNDQLKLKQSSVAIDDNAQWLAELKILANKVKASFRKTFLIDESPYLLDCVREDESIMLHRANGIIALSLPYDLLEPLETLKVFSAAQSSLWTPYGLRSLAANEPEYKGIYLGDVLQRDGAYHRGTVWAWLLGPYLEVMMKIHGHSQDGKRVILQHLLQLCEHLEDTALGQLSEIFDGDLPHQPRGCMAQAWSVAEALRILTTVAGNSAASPSLNHKQA